jgi:transposase InsO family protein
LVSIIVHHVVSGRRCFYLLQAQWRLCPVRRRVRYRINRWSPLRNVSPLPRLFVDIVGGYEHKHYTTDGVSRTRIPSSKSSTARCAVSALSLHWFLGLEDRQRMLKVWRDDYNNRRPHSSWRTSRRSSIGPPYAAVPRTAASWILHRPGGGLKSGRPRPRSHHGRLGEPVPHPVSWTLSKPQL